jgi:hypothetical protein
MKTNEYYSEKYDSGMLLRNGKRINCIYNSSVYKQLKNIYNFSEEKGLWENGIYCSQRCEMLQRFINVLSKNYKILYENMRFCQLYYVVQDKIKKFIIDLKAGALENECECINYYSYELEKLNTFYNQPTKIHKELYFKLSTLMNKDVSYKILEYTILHYNDVKKINSNM